ncbi:uncharacterized protein M421DRAFT_423373 [Didymella exigua CBS 183.55]|uniref:Uncharacterized protein n=1 Tax=Didymella exigua CBS 183.55 TaxID=1150837 RepID=A0A6A5REA3_9PLEO|nr:uncharacterized protein M421DRAFT_423373 [Didymella exigua CBS 183.55]KAF1925813.1 hypothetical protein M421DRAFT_423373 [Didymella exigua CBS 183.55]
MSLDKNTKQMLCHYGLYSVTIQSLPLLFLLTRVRSSTPPPSSPTHHPAPAHHPTTSHSPASSTTHHTSSTHPRATHTTTSVVHNVRRSSTAAKAAASAHRHTGTMSAATAGHARRSTAHVIAVYMFGDREVLECVDAQLAGLRVVSILPSIRVSLCSRAGLPDDED